MEERTLFDRIHEALDVEPRPGAYERLRTALASKRVKPQRWPAFPMRSPKLGLRLAAVMTVVVLAIAAAAAFLVTHPVADRETPADSERAIAAYKLMLYDDYIKIPDPAIESVCFGNQFAACDADVSVRIPVVNQIQNDLNRLEPPARFAVAVGQMRRHNALQLTRLNAVLAASRAQDAAGMDRSVAAVVSGRPWMDAMFTGLLQGTAAQVGSFQRAVVLVAAPSSMATRDNRLQVDLATADTALVTMAEALSAGDQAGFNAGRASLQQAMAAVNVDAADILNG